MVGDFDVARRNASCPVIAGDFGAGVCCSEAAGTWSRVAFDCVSMVCVSTVAGSRRAGIDSSEAADSISCDSFVRFVRSITAVTDFALGDFLRPAWSLFGGDLATTDAALLSTFSRRERVGFSAAVVEAAVGFGCCC